MVITISKGKVSTNPLVVSFEEPRTKVDKETTGSPSSVSNHDSSTVAPTREEVRL